MLRLFPEYLKGEELFGLTVHAVLRIAESVGPRVGMEASPPYWGSTLLGKGLVALLLLPLDPKSFCVPLCSCRALRAARTICSAMGATL